MSDDILERELKRVKGKLGDLQAVERPIVVTDHGALSGLADDDHTQYLKEKASGGVAGEVPTHTHADADNAGTVDHGALDGLGDDDHTQYLNSARHALEDHSGLITVHWPDNPPASPTAQDDEFEAAALDGKWTVSSTAASYDVHTTWPSRVFVSFTGNQYFQIAQGYAAAATFSLMAKFHHAAMANLQSCEIACCDDDESDYARISVEYVTSSPGPGWVIKLATKDAGPVNIRATTLVPGSSTWYLYIRRASNTWYVFASHDGYSWFNGGSYAKTFTVDHFYLQLAQNGRTNPMRCGIDWVRRDVVAMS